VWLFAGLGDEVSGEARNVAARQARADVHALRSILALVDRRAQLVELGQPGSLVVGQQQANVLEPLAEVACDCGPKLFEPLPGER
jgi:hypothetical protein